MRETLAERICHVWFSAKRRIPLLEGEVEDDLRRLLREQAAGAEARLLEAETGIDHVRLVLAVPEKKPLAQVMQQIKGGSSYALSLKYPDLKADMGQAALWQKGYRFQRLEADEVQRARGYVRTQQSRPLRHR